MKATQIINDLIYFQTALPNESKKSVKSTSVQKLAVGNQIVTHRKRFTRNGYSYVKDNIKTVKSVQKSTKHIGFIKVVSYLYNGYLTTQTLYYKPTERITIIKQ